jgi:hypothetical protein
MKRKQYADFEELAEALSACAVVIHDVLDLLLAVILFVASDYEKYHL